MTIERRELFPILATAVVTALNAQHAHHKPALVSTSAYKRQAFNDEQNTILDLLADIIIPADPKSGGAHDALVANYFDLVAHHVPAVKKAFEDGLNDFNSLALVSFGHPLAHLDRKQLTELLAVAAQQEGAASTPQEKFFELLKFHTVEGYRLSHIGQSQWIGYKPHAPGLYPDFTIDA